MKETTRAIVFNQLGPEKGLRFTRQWVMRLVKAGKFPAPRCRGRNIYWLEEDIDAWLRSGTPYDERRSA